MNILKKIQSLCCGIFILTSPAYSQEINNSFSFKEIGNNQLLIENKINTVHTIQKKIGATLFSSIDLGPNYISSNQIGYPEIPILSKLIEIPEEAEIYIDILVDSCTTYNLNEFENSYPLAPTQMYGSKKRTIEKFSQNKEIYTSNSFWHLNLIDVKELGSMGSVRMAKIILSPIEYNPVKKQIKIHHIVKIAIRFEKADFQKTMEKKEKTNQIYNPILNKNILNYKNLNPKQSTLPKHPFKYVIVSPREFQPSLVPFIEWKKKKGFEVIEVYTDDTRVGATSTSIKSYLKNLYQAATPSNPAPTYLLLVGNHQMIPPFKRRFLDSGFYFTDLYFAEYTDDFYPDIFYGRFPVNNTQELDNIVEKTIAYEKLQMQNESYLNKGILIAGNDNQVDISSIVTTGVLNYLKHTYFSINPKIDAQLYYNEVSSGKKTEIIEKIKMGNSIVYYTGHSSEDRWQLGQNSISSFDLLPDEGNTTYYFMINNCCLSNKYDHPNCFGRNLLCLSNSGSIGVIGATSETYWMEDFYWASGAKEITINPTYNANILGAFDRFFHTNNEALNQQYITQGQIISAGNLAVSQSESYFEQLYWEIYCLFGDPSLMPYIGLPTPNPIELPASIEKGADSISISGAPFTYVHLYANDTVSLATGLIDEKGTIQLKLKSPIVDELNIQVVGTKQFGKPFFDSIPVLAPEKGKIIWTNYALYDKNGFPIEKIRGNDTFLVKVNFQNIGLQATSNISIEVNCIDPIFGNCSHNSFQWNQILPSEQVEKDMIQLIVYDNLMGNTLYLKMIINEENGKYEYMLPIPVFSPLLEISNLKISSLNSGISFDTINVLVSLSNVGMDTAKDYQIYISSSETPVISTISQYNKNSSIDLAPFTTDIIPLELTSPVNRGDDYITAYIHYSYLGGKTKIKSIQIPFQKNSEDFETGDFLKFPWKQSSTPWTIESNPEFVNEGKYCARSGIISDGKKTSLSIKQHILQDDSIHFMIKVSCEQNDYDFLGFYIDENLERIWSGQKAWTKISIPVTAGDHTFSWTFHKDFSDSDGQDCAWIDQIQFPLITAPLQISSIPKKEKYPFVIYPNPSSGIIYIDNPLPNTNSDLIIYDLSGKIQFKSKLTQSTSHIDLKDLRNGIYFLVIQNRIHKSVHKIILSK